MKAVVFGAGNIGRSFIAPIFRRGGYEVVFVDVNPKILGAIALRGAYEVVVVESERPELVVAVNGVRAVDGRDRERVAEEVASADLAATAVGQAALPAVAAAIVSGLAERARRGRSAPLDVILAENVRSCAALMGDLIRKAAGSRKLAPVGLVETSIGKMVPIVPADRAAADPLIVYAEPYNTLIVDRRGFLGPVPDVTDLLAVERIDAYVDRKLFVHNLGHAAAAYLAWRTDPSLRYLADAMELPAVRDGARRAMAESAKALARVYDDVFTEQELLDHAGDLLRRFANRALGDTIHRVGRDLRRKLAREDRLVGAMLLCARTGLPFDSQADAYVAALAFACPDEFGRPGEADRAVLDRVRTAGIRWAFGELSGLVQEDPVDRAVMEAVRKASGRGPQAGARA